MSTNIREGLREIGRAQESSRAPVEFNELKGAATIDPGTRRPRRSEALVSSPGVAAIRGPAVAVGAALVVVGLVGGLAILMSPTEPFLSAQPEASGSVVEITDDPSIFSGPVGPLGPVVVELDSSRTDFIPGGDFYGLGGGATTKAYGGIVEMTSGGFLALGVTADASSPAIATSANGISWELVDFAPEIPGFPLASARLFEAGGWFWISLNEPYIYRSSDTIDWERIDLGGSTPSPMGVPLVDQRWHRFGDQLVSPSSDTDLIAVDIRSGKVQRFERPWALPGGSGWWWMTTIDEKLTVFVSSVPDTPERAENPVIEQYETADLVTWNGPLKPAFATDDTSGVLVSGDSTNGLVALNLTGKWYGSINSGRVGLYFSADGKTWREFTTVANPSGRSVWKAIDQNPTPIRVSGQQGIALLNDQEFLLSADGQQWQMITPLDRGGLPPPPDHRWGSSWTRVGNRIFYYEFQRSDDGPAALNTWVITIGP